MDELLNNRAVPAVSVIMPAYNMERFIDQAIRSVMDQTMTDWELLVIDDGSTDDTCAIVERLACQDCRIRLYRNPENLGVAKTRNRGFELSRGEYVALLDSDDLWLPEKLEKQLALAKRTGAELVYCSYAIVDAGLEKVREDYLVPERADFETLLKENVIGCSTVLLRRELTRDHRFEPAYLHEDYVLWLELLRQGYSAAGCTEPLTKWRLIANSRSFDKRKSAKSRWMIYRDYLHLPLGRRIRCFAAYAAAGMKKYKKSANDKTR